MDSSFPLPWVFFSYSIKIVCQQKHWRHGSCRLILQPTALLHSLEGNTLQNVEASFKLMWFIHRNTTFDF